MNINATLIGQMITFLVLVGVTMKYIWPPMMQALENRRKQIAEGLEAAERGRHELELARQKIKEQFHDTKDEINQLLTQANSRAARIVEDAKEKAKEEGERLVNLAREQINQEVQAAKDTLMQQIANLTMIGVERVLEKKIDESMNNQLVDQLIAEI